MSLLSATCKRFMYFFNFYYTFSLKINFPAFDLLWMDLLRCHSLVLFCICDMEIVDVLIKLFFRSANVLISYLIVVSISFLHERSQTLDQLYIMILMVTLL
jgi:hypothetical protein